MLGFFSSVIAVIFWFWLNIPSSGLNIRRDIDGYFSEYIINFLIRPYFELFLYQLLFIILLLIGSKFEKNYYISNDKEGLLLFEYYDKIYSKLFLVGIFLNFLPLLIIFIIVLGYIFKHL